MNLLERIQAGLCREPGCRRAPAHAGQAYCAAHRDKWVPEWRRRLTSRDETGWVKAA